MQPQLADLQRQEKALRNFRQWIMETLEGPVAFKEMLADFPRNLLHWLCLSHAAAFSQEAGRLHLKKALQGEDVKPWKIPRSLQKHLIETGQKALQENDMHWVEGFVLLPLHCQEIKNEQLTGELLPLGVVVLKGEGLSISIQALLARISHFIRLVSSRQRRLEEVVQNAKTLSSELSQIRKDYAQKKKLLQFHFNYDHIIGGNAPAMMEVYQLLEKVIPSTSSVLIEGEAGTGRELVARTIHYQGPMGTKPLVHVNCGSLNPQIVESQLFGYVKGAFTGAKEDQPGLIAQADGGTLFLDELDALPLEVQAKLLRVLQEGEVSPVGSSHVKTVHFRILSTLGPRVETLLRKKRIREDLFYRLNVISISLPPLRERREDIPLLVDFFCKEYSESKGKPRKKISRKALDVLGQAPWPGNITQLKNTLEMIFTLNSVQRIDRNHLPEDLKKGAEVRKPQSLRKAKEKFYQEYVDHLLSHCGGNVSQAAQLAGVKRESFYRMLRRSPAKKTKRKRSKS